MLKYICENCECEHNRSYGSDNFCSEYCKSSYVSKHVKTHYSPFKNKNSYKENNIGKPRSEYGTWVCKDCNIIFETRKELRQHRIDVHKRKDGLPWNKGLTKETSPTIAKWCKDYKQHLDDGTIIPFWLGKNHSDETKKKLSDIANEKVANNEWHFSISKLDIYEYNGVKLHNTWELKYAMYLDEHNIKWERPNIGYPYIFEEKEHHYYPDFYLPDSDTYVEIKGRQRNVDLVKWEYFKKEHNLIVLKQKDLEKLLGEKLDKKSIPTNYKNST